MNIEVKIWIVLNIILSRVGKLRSIWYELSRNSHG